MKECELCSDPARMYCESDQASLCWSCDEKVHCANFLVARHCRSLLCHVCKSPTPWTASGTKLGHTVSVCESCVSRCNGKRERGGDEEESHGENEEDKDTDDDDEDDYEDEEDEDGDYSDGGGDEEEDEDEDEDGENQVVPWSNTPPPVASSSSSEVDCSSRFGNGGVSALKRMRETAVLDSDDDIDLSSFQLNQNALSRALTSQASGDDEATSFKSLRLLKERRIAEPIHTARVENHSEGESRSTAIITSLKRFQENIVDGDDATSMILGIRKLSRDPRAVDLDTINSAIPNPTV